MRIKRCVCRLQTPDFRISQRCFSESNKIPEPEIVKGPSLLKTRQGRLERPSPSLLHLPGLRSLPFWTRTHPKKATLVAYQEPSIQEAVYLLENNWEIIRNEYTNSKLPPSDYQTDTEHTLHKGTWEWHTYMRKGVVLDSFRNNFRQTAEILDSLPNLFRGVPFGYTFFSTLHRQTEIQPHSAPMNFRVRIHLPLILPDDSSENELGLRVGSLTRSWHEGKALVSNQYMPRFD